MENQPTFFDFAAEVGVTKHLGGVEATDDLAALCGIEAGKTVLDVGCGVGVTPVYLAEKYGCKVVGVDIKPKMIERCIERAEREGITDLVEFRVGDVLDLPFEDEIFDAVISESVVSFPKDKQQALNECARVTKAGGYVGLNESVWLKVPPPPEVVAWASQDVGSNVMPLTVAEWTATLEGAGLQDIIVKSYAVNTMDEAKKIYRRYGLGSMLRSQWRALKLYARSPHYRAFIKGVRQGGLVPPNLNEYFGYGIFVGMK
jgi:arsenite methyltransferase